MKAIAMKRNGQKGFTLIELLVVIGIMGVLAAVAVPAYSKFFGAGKTEARSTELVTIQAAMDDMMADKQIAVVDAQATLAGDFSALPTGTGASPLYPTYLRTQPTRCQYTWDATGRLTQDPACN